MTDCPLCINEALPAGWTLGPACTRATRMRCRDVVAYLRELDTQLTRQTGASDGGSGGDRVVFDLAASAARAELVRVVDIAVGIWHESAVIPMHRHATLGKLLGSTSGRAALLAGLPDLGHQPWSGMFAEALHVAILDAQNAIDRPEATTFAGWCPGEANRPCGRALYALVGSGTACCATCGQVTDARAGREHALDQLTTQRGTATQLGRALGIPAGRIRKWAHRGEIEADDTDPAHPTYSVAEVRARDSRATTPPVPHQATPPEGIAVG